MKAIRKILFFFNAAQKKKLAALLLCICTVGFFEMISIAAILPFIVVATNPQLIETNYYLSTCFRFLGFTNSTYFMLFLGGVLFSVLLLGNLFSALTAWLVLRFSYHCGQRISTELLRKYLSQSYTFFLNQNSNDLTKNIISEVDRFVTGVIIGTLQALNKLIMVSCIFLLLLFVNPSLAITVIAVLGSAYLAVYWFIRRKLATAGRVSSAINFIRFRALSEAMGAIKELKVLGRENKFLEEFLEAAKIYARAETLSQLSPMVARYIIEVIAFGGMLLIALFLISKGEMSEFMPLLGLYALAGYRLMPAMQQLFASLTLCRYHFPALEILYQEMQRTDAQSIAPCTDIIPFNHSITLSNVGYTYPFAQKEIFESIDLSIIKNTTIGFVGASGAGKTTLVDLILGLLAPSQGTLLIDGIVITQENRRAWQRNIGYVPQNIFLLDNSIENNIALGEPEHQVDHKAVEKAAKLANLHNFIIQELPLGYKTPIGEAGVRLSGGQRQRIGIARALYHNPNVLIFDEATSALDNDTEQAIIQSIKKLSHEKTIIIIAHRLSTVEDCDVIYFIEKGKIMDHGTFSELTGRNQLFRKIANIA